jgi:putative transposase
MAREARIVLPGVAHHVTQRGNNRQDVFFVEDDYRIYGAYLKESMTRYGLAVSAYCFMTNHIHLIATPETEESLSKALGRTHLIYAQYVHRLHGRSGHFWQNRFYSCPLDEAHAHNAAAYAELNPVRAGMAVSAWDYPWSSAAAHCGDGRDLLGLLMPNRGNEQMPSVEWKATLGMIAASDGGSVERLRRHTRTGHPLGDDAFLSKVESLLGRRVRPLPIGRQIGWRKQKANPHDDERRADLSAPQF